MAFMRHQNIVLPAVNCISSFGEFCTIWSSPFTRIYCNPRWTIINQATPILQGHKLWPPMRQQYCQDVIFSIVKTICIKNIADLWDRVCVCVSAFYLSLHMTIFYRQDDCRCVRCFPFAIPPSSQSSHTNIINYMPKDSVDVETDVHFVVKQYITTYYRILLCPEHGMNE